MNQTDTIKSRYLFLKKQIQESQHWIQYVSASWDYDDNHQAYQTDRNRHDKIIDNATKEMKHILDKYPHKLI
jgi:hypothetical protein